MKTNPYTPQDYESIPVKVDVDFSFVNLMIGGGSVLPIKRVIREATPRRTREYIAFFGKKIAKLEP